MRFGIQLKLTLLIVGLITAIFIALGTYIAREKKTILTETAIATAKKELASLAFIASRAILDRDDLALADSLQNAQGLPGFTLGAVYVPPQKTVLINRIGKELDERQQKEIERAALETVRAHWDAIVSTPPALGHRLETPFSGKTDASLLYFHRAVFHPFVKVNPPLLAVAQVAITDQYIRQSVRQSLLELLIVGGIFFLGALVAAYLLSRFVVKPVKILSRGAEEVGKGNLDYTLPPLGSDELGQLARQFNEMTASLKRASEEAKEQAVLNDQIRQAKEIQEGMNPARFLKKPEYQIKGFTRAAKGVGGDYYDFQVLGDGRVALLISDVSGKSISASLVMVLIKTVVATYLKLFNSIRPDTIIRTINRVMCSQAHIDKFATIQFLLFDPATKVLEFSNGGHGPIFLYRAARRACTVSKLEGLPMGIEEDNVYRLAKLQLESGDIVLLYTDGITECWNAAREDFGLRRLREKLIEYADLNAKEIIENLVRELDEYAAGAEQHDDMTMVVMKVL
ncbi:MAG: PP2C family protein-serine/threonine phosphatase [Turneriella sp.]|nr:PP2C family protein-serine/threonine phosphatase [Turneriella sp.]